MGKYTHLKGQMTKLSSEPEYQDRVNNKRIEIKAELIKEFYPVSPLTCGRVLLKARLEKDRLEQEVKAQNLIIEAMNQELVELMEASDFNKVTLTDEVTLAIKDDVYCVVKDKQAFHTWISETDQEDLLTVNYQTMSALAKKRLLDGEALPPGIDTYFKQSITVYGGKNVEGQ